MKVPLLCLLAARVALALSTSSLAYGTCTAEGSRKSSFCPPVYPGIEHNDDLQAAPDVRIRRCFLPPACDHRYSPHTVRWKEVEERIFVLSAPSMRVYMQVDRPPRAVTRNSVAGPYHERRCPRFQPTIIIPCPTTAVSIYPCVQLVLYAAGLHR